MNDFATPTSAMNDLNKDATDKMASDMMTTMNTGMEDMMKGMTDKMGDMTTGMDDMMKNMSDEM